MANNNNKNVTLDQLTTMDTTIKNYIQSKDGDLVGLLTVDKSNLTNAIKEIGNDLEDVDTTATAIDTTVDGIIGDTTVAVNLVEGEDTVEINGENLVCKTYAISQNDTPIATINVPVDLSVEEGVVISETNDNTGETTTYLKLKTTGANEYNLSLDVSFLVSGFSVQQDGILTLESGEITGELEDNSVENSNIIDGNITEEKLSLGLQEKLEKENYAERDIAVLKTEAETLIGLHKEKEEEEEYVEERYKNAIETEIGKLCYSDQSISEQISRVGDWYNWTFAGFPRSAFLAYIRKTEEGKYEVRQQISEEMVGDVYVGNFVSKDENVNSLELIDIKFTDVVNSEVFMVDVSSGSPLSRENVVLNPLKISYSNAIETEVGKLNRNGVNSDTISEQITQMGDWYNWRGYYGSEFETPGLIIRKTEEGKYEIKQLDEEQTVGTVYTMSFTSKDENVNSSELIDIKFTDVVNSEVFMSNVSFGQSLDGHFIFDPQISLTSTSYYSVAEEIAKNIDDIPLATTTANGLMPKEDVVALDGTYIDTVNNKLYIKGQEVILNSTASDDDVDDIIDNFLGTRKIPITNELTAGEGYCYEPSDEEEDGVMGVRITEDNKANFIDSSFYTLVGNNHDENYVFVPEQGFDTMQQFLQFQDNAVTLVKKVAIAADEDRARADHAYYTRAYYQDDKQDVKITQKNYDKMFYTKQAHKKVQNNWTDLYGQEVVLNSTDDVDTVKTLLNNANDEGLFDASYSEEEFNKQRAFDETTNNTSTGEQVEVVDFDTSKLGGYVAYVQASGTYVSGTAYYADDSGNTEVDTTGFDENTDVSSYYVSSKHNFFAKNKIIKTGGNYSKIQTFMNWIFENGKINASSIQPGGVAYIQNDLVGLAAFVKLQKQHTAANNNKFNKENFDKVLGRTILEHPNEGRYVQATGTYVSGTTYYTDNTGSTEIDTTGFVEGVTDVSNYFKFLPKYIVYAYNIIRDNTQANAPLNVQEKVPNDILEYVTSFSSAQDRNHVLDENNQSNYGSIAFTTLEATKRYLEYNGRIPSSEPTIVAPNWSRLPGVVHISTVKFINEEDEFTTIDDTPNHYVSLRNLKKLLLNKNVEYVKVSFNAGVVNHDTTCWGNPPELEAEDALKTRTIDTSEEAKAVEVTAENLWEFRGKRFSFEIPKLPDGSRAQTSNGNTTLENYNTLNPYNYVYWDGEPHEENKDIYTEDFRNAYRGVYSSDIGRTVWVDKGQLTI